MKTYEAMFLLDSGHASAHWDERVDEIKDILQRHGAEIIRLVKWDDRRLAYPIQHCKRGVYMLCFYRAPRETNARIERDVQLSDNLLRVLVVRREKMTEDQMLLCKAPSGEANIVGRSPEPAAPAKPDRKDEPAKPAPKPDEGPKADDDKEAADPRKTAGAAEKA